MFERCLKRLGIATIVTNNLAEAESAVRLHRPNLALVDLYLTEEIEEEGSPQKCIRFATRWGIDVISALRAIDENITILLWSVHMSRAYAREALAAGANGTADKADGIERVLDSLADGAPSAPNYERTLTLEQNEWEHVTKVFVDNNRSVSGTARDLATSRTRVLRKLWSHAPTVSHLASRDTAKAVGTMKCEVPVAGSHQTTSESQSPVAEWSQDTEAEFLVSG